MTTAEQSHRAHVKARKERSATWRVIHFLGSLKLALLLLATIAIACAVATFYESSFNTKIAQAYIYKAPWFLVWLGVLCVNLFAVTLTRWPWQRKHLGFVITHYGIITLLIGAVIGSQFGFEGNVTLHKGEPPQDRITTSRSMVQIENPSTGGFTLERFDPTLARPSEKHPAHLAVPGSDLQIVVDDHSENLIEQEQIIASAAPDARPGALLDFASGMMGQNIRLPLLLGTEHDFFGLASIHFLPVLPERVAKVVRETQIVFAKFAPVTQAEGGSTGVTAALSADGQILTITASDTPPQEHRRAEIAGKKLTIGGANIELGDYWPDFKLENGRPTSVSDQPNNPAVLLRIAGPDQPAPGTRAKPLLEIAPADGGLNYQLSRAGRVYAKGLAKVGEPFSTGWADWRATVTNFLPKAAAARALEPGAEDVQGLAGFRARLRAPDGREGPPAWIRAGTLTPIMLGDTALRIGYGLELRTVPFTIELEDFEVPRVEGTDTPSNFIASVKFRDKETGDTKQGTARMNHPASWPGTAFSVTTGFNYKFSQAQWNPEDLGQTTLQVLYDPGWLLKWVGSLAICAGIFIMFYLRPRKS